METACLRHTELPNASRLFTDFLYHYDRVARFYRAARHRGELSAGSPRSFGGSLARAESRTIRRWKFGATGHGGVCNGPASGLFSGPAYTIYKALTAVRLAEESTKNGKPAVAIFWLATEDHDFAEVNHAWAFDARCTRAVSSGRTSGPRQAGWRPAYRRLAD